MDRPLDGVAADRVEHDVDVTDRLGEVDRRVVDDLVGAEPLDELPLASARGRDHVRAERLRELDRDVADAAATAVDQHTVALAHAAEIDEPLSRRQPDDRQRGRLDV